MKHQATKSARVIQVIETVALRGSGQDNDPVRTVTQYWGNLDDIEALDNANLLAESDPELCCAPSPKAYHVQSAPVSVRNAKITERYNDRWVLTIGDLSKPHLQTQIALPRMAMENLATGLIRFGFANPLKESTSRGE